MSSWKRPAGLPPRRNTAAFTKAPNYGGSVGVKWTRQFEWHTTKQPKHKLRYYDNAWTVTSWQATWIRQEVARFR